MTERIKLFPSVAVLTLPPAIAARMAVTIDSIAPGRFGVNIVSGWQHPEYSQHDLWLGDGYFGYRYDYSSEYVQVMKELWANGKRDFKGRHFQMDDCRLLSKPSGDIKIVAAGLSPVGMGFAAKYCDYNFIAAFGFNEPTAYADTNARLMQAVAETGRDVGSYVLMMVIADETDEAAMAKWRHHVDGRDPDALSWVVDQSNADAHSGQINKAKRMSIPDQAVNFNMLTLVGSYANVARVLDEAATVPGTKGLMLTFDDFIIGMEQFGTRIQPLMKSRAGKPAIAA